MSWKTLAAAMGLGVSLAAYAPSAHAFDRKDGPAATATANTDIVDLYAWMQPIDAKRVYLIMTVNPDADKTTTRFSTTALYVIHTNARTNPQDTSPAPEVQVICRFDGATPQNAECWAGANEYVKGPVGRQNASKTGNLIVQAGPRNDPFFANDAALTASITSINNTVKTKSASRDAAGCYPFLAAEQTALKLSLSPVGGTDSFKTKTVMAIVVSVDTTILVPVGKPSLSVWGSTNQPL